MCITIMCFSTAASVLGFFVLLQMKPAPNTFSFQNDRVEKVFPKVPSDYPEELKGLFWMDQLGHFAHSDIPLAAPDLALAFDGPLDRKSGIQKINTFGNSWQWMNNKFALVAVRIFHMIGFFYTFEWNADFSHAQIYPSLNWWGMEFVSVPKALLSFTMVKQIAPDGACPPKVGATKMEVSKCAKFDRVSKGLLTPLVAPLLSSLGLGDSEGNLHYYVFQIVDANGARVQPYYDKYLEWAKLNANPSPGLASVLGYNFDAAYVSDPSATFIATPPAGQATPSKDKSTSNQEL